MQLSIRCIALMLALCLLSAIGSAHVPEIAGGQVTVVPDAAKSYAWYGILETGDEVDLYLLTVGEGGEIRLSLSTPDRGTAPTLALTGPGLDSTDPLPGGIVLPDGQGSIGMPADRQAVASYEPFTPMAIYERAELSIRAPVTGEYSVLVSGDEGRYTLATGYLEEFSIAEWVLVPVQVLAVRVWQGQPLLLVLLPVIGSVAAGILWFRKRTDGIRLWPGAWLLAVAGFSYIGSGILIITEMVIAGMVTGPESTMMITVIFAALPLVLGYLMVRNAGRLIGPPSLRDRGVILLYGILGFVFWAGVIIGPVLAIAAACMPECPVCRRNGEKRV
ncbi:MAG: hypothetical protein GKC06_06705 [Methanomicrobiales archaeon]|nr:hypothetical protein [Methanomicrobiales archaeon]